MSVEGQDGRAAKRAKFLADRRESPSLVNIGLGDGFDAGWTAALVESEARERELREECEKRGLPVDVAGLIRHCESNASLAVAFDKIGAEKREAVLVEALKEIANCPNRGSEAESVDGQAWNDRAWAIGRARAALAGVVEAEPDGSER